MTFNATALHVQVLSRAGFVERGFFVESGLEVRRRVFVTPEVHFELSQRSQNASSTQSTLDTFRAGWLINVSRRPEVKNAELKLLEKVDEVWAMAFRRPRMVQRRMLGRFIAKDIFVGLGLFAREDLAGKKYTNKANEAISAWEDRLACEPLRSSSFSDYISPVFRDLDDDD